MSPSSENMGVIETKPHPLHDIAARALLDEIFRNRPCTQLSYAGLEVHVLCKYQIINFTINSKNNDTGSQIKCPFTIQNSTRQSKRHTINSS